MKNCDTCGRLKTSYYMAVTGVVCDMVECVHESCFEKAFDPLHGGYKKRVLDYRDKNKDGQCADWIERPPKKKWWKRK